MNLPGFDPLCQLQQTEPVQVVNTKFYQIQFPHPFYYMMRRLKNILPAVKQIIS